MVTIIGRIFMLCVGVGIAQFVIQFCLQTILHELGNGLLEQALDVLHAADVRPSAAVL